MCGWFQYCIEFWRSEGCHQNEIKKDNLGCFKENQFLEVRIKEEGKLGRRLFQLARKENREWSNFWYILKVEPIGFVRVLWEYHGVKNIKILKMILFIIINHLLYMTVCTCYSPPSQFFPPPLVSHIITIGLVFENRESVSVF